MQAKVIVVVKFAFIKAFYKGNSQTRIRRTRGGREGVSWLLFLSLSLIPHFVSLRIQFACYIIKPLASLVGLCMYVAKESW